MAENKDLKEKIKILEAQIAAAEEEGNEDYRKYLLRVKNLTIHNYAGGQIFINSGTPPPPPPYGGG